ncbi:LysM peptidoglycan-binding domain-containing protein [Phaeobacter italicus]|uniref:LysM peptidoglycan-binding domain-containing protein n=1 Tax=Phaeobacter italicus TaxID=481446 RepID=UPI00248F2B09|nr:LysM peptidoglycan-binding domain-containing protein [Phaeobacter italicus]
MTDEVGKSGISATAIGGVAAVVAVIGGVIYLQWGGASDPVAPADQTGASDVVVISPANTDQAAATPAASGAGDAADDTAAQTDTETPATTGAPETVAEADTEVSAEPEPTAEPSEEAAEPASDAEDVANADAADDAATAPAAVDPDEDVAETSASLPPLAAPEMDLARFESDGSGVIAGRAEPGSEISILLDAAEIDALRVPADGNFVAFVTVPLSDQPQVISLIARRGEEERASDAQFILAPVAPVVVAEAAQAPVDPAPTSDTEITATAEAAVEVVQDLAEDVTTAVADAANETAEALGDAASAVAAEVAEIADSAAEPAAPQPVDAPDPVAEPQSAPLVADTAQSDPQPVPETTETADAGADVDPAPKPAAPKQVAVLRSDASGVQLVQPATPANDAPATGVALDTISYDAEGDVILSGRGEADAVVRAYLDNKAVADLAVAGDGRWTGKLANVAPGIYNLRLDALDASGKVLSRLETPFKREAPEVLAPAPETPAAPDAAPVADSTTPVPPVRAITVQKGDTLWAISRERYGDGLLYVRVFDANRDAIRNPDLIYPGQVFTIPEQ